MQYELKNDQLISFEHTAWSIEGIYGTAFTFTLMLVLIFLGVFLQNRTPDPFLLGVFIALSVAAPPAINKLIEHFWLPKITTLEDAQKLSEALKVAEKLDIDLPLLPPGPIIECLTNKQLKNWCITATMALQKYNRSRVLAGLQFPARYAQSNAPIGPEHST
ncbi:hypothetical protein [Marinobacter sp. ELB17]|uniref:hypothetical protein n=1 Tax=Marinobacter sp. ELB17 TaxID=270374 RepID=UPI0000F388C5|nr:hypothetical protein [Marinobacter sp. ELB17]EAZ97342.1 hypothetical protein MELB17_09398 [Marinobacter sp. ELB17]